MRDCLKILIIGLALAAAHPALAQDQAETLVVAQSGCKTLSQAVEQVRRQYGGRIVSAETRTSGNREVHHIKVLTEDGKVRTVQVPGCSRGSG